MTKLRKTEKWTFSLTLVAAIAGATLFGGFYGNRLFGSPVQSEVSKRFKEYTDLLGADNLEFAIRLEADRLVNSDIKREALLTEMTVVRNEFEMRENSPK